MNIRTAAPEDASALLDIYAPYVRDTAITFEYQVPTSEEFADRIRNTLKKYPYLIAEENGELLGYVYASPFKTRAAYDWSVETSVYVKQGNHRRGVGRALYETLEDCLRRQHICNLCACITYPNPTSIAFHESLGYRMIAHFHSSGFKLGQWHDMVWMEKVLCSHEIPPMPFLPFPEMNSLTPLA